MERQQRFKLEFDKRIKKIKHNIREGDYVYIDPTDGMSKIGKLEIPALELFRILRNDGRKFFIQRNENVERINADRVTYAPPPEETPRTEAFAPTVDNISKNTEDPTSVVDKLLENRVTS